MAQTYDKVNDILDGYLEGDISYEEFRDKIDEFRETDAEYLIRSGSN